MLTILTCAHPEENLPVSVVELHPVVASRVNKLVAGGALGLQYNSHSHGLILVEH